MVGSVMLGFHGQAANKYYLDVPEVVEEAGVLLGSFRKLGYLILGSF